MKHLKKFESLRMLKDWNMILSDSDFKMYAKFFFKKFCVYPNPLYICGIIQGKVPKWSNGSQL